MDGSLTITPKLDKKSKANRRGSRLLVFVNDRDSYDAAEELVEKLALPDNILRTGDISFARSFLSSDDPPDVVIVDLGDVDEPIRLTRDLNAHLRGESAIIVLGRVNDVSFFRALQDAGAQEYLVKPVSMAQLRDSIAASYQAIKERRQPTNRSMDGATEPGKITVVCGVRGGVGTSTIANNLAWHLAHEQKKKTVMVDLDLYFGVANLSFDLAPSASLRDVLSDPQRMDDLLLSSALVNESERLSVLGSEEDLIDDVPDDPEAIDSLFNELTGQFNQVVVDVPRWQIPNRTGLLDRAEKIIVVSDLTIPGLRDCFRLRTHMENMGKGEALKIVASRVSKTKEGQISQAHFEKGLKHKIDFVVPEEEKAVGEAANNGRAVAAAAGRSGFAAALRKMAVEIGGPKPEGARSKNLVGKLLNSVGMV